MEIIFKSCIVFCKTRMYLLFNMEVVMCYWIVMSLMIINITWKYVPALYASLIMLLFIVFIL